MEIREKAEILLVEDNPNDVELTERALKKHKLGVRMHVVRDGEQALDYIFCRNTFKDRNNNELPKLILLDLKLPKVTGLEVLEKVKSNERTRNIPVVVLTTSREERDMVKSYELGVNSYIVKPVDYNKFVDSVAEIGLYWLLMNEIPDYKSE
ncbi:MAG: response regulator [Bacteroidales bacterium]|nr:response regulator [Bacteroidales bacterium]MCF8343217.1 response regulator [Bacteroidales bacterium]MCF8351336.1 response regulator [Bacteroidales bacterium]MCF8376884.1 response regulator [Bacteroidales bacterium]MCF8401511.1 response regulator [Bacteroidales bacterium]